MRVAIVGYGRMGHEVERILRMRGHEATSLIDPAVPAEETSGRPMFRSVSSEALENCDVAIEFSHSDGVPENVEVYCASACPAVIGTTGWDRHLDQVRRRVIASEIGVVYGSNFSIGAHLLVAISRHAASLVAGIEEYDLQIHEVHHRMKKDSPSGTALTLAKAILDAVPRKTVLETARLDRAPEANELHVSSSRVGSVPGTHTLTLDSQADTIEVRHTARNRGGFALGAVRAAEWIVGRPGPHPVEEFITDLLHT